MGLFLFFYSLPNILESSKHLVFFYLFNFILFQKFLICAGAYIILKYVYVYNINRIHIYIFIYRTCALMKVIISIHNIMKYHIDLMVQCLVCHS